MVQNAFTTALFRANAQTKHQKKETLEFCQTIFEGEEKLYKLKAAIGVTIINPLDSDFYNFKTILYIDACTANDHKLQTFNQFRVGKSTRKIIELTSSVQSAVRQGIIFEVCKMLPDDTVAEPKLRAKYLFNN